MYKSNNLNECNTAFASRLLTRAQAATYCGLSPSGFSEWVANGKMPGPLRRTARWDLRAIDAALDDASGLPKLLNAQYDIFDTWKRGR